MSLTARTIANNASFQAFANCYLREVDSGDWHAAASWQASPGVHFGRGETHVVEIELPAVGESLAIGVSFRSRVGRHTLTDVYRKRRLERDWRSIDPLSVQLLLIDALYDGQLESPRRLELIHRVVESHQVMAQYVEHKLGGSAAIAGFIESEQATVLGHWLHPTPKSRQGMNSWQHAHYAPELGGRFQLHFFAVERRLVQQASILDTPAEQLSLELARRHASSCDQQRIATALDEGRCLVPVHPLQAEWLSHQDYVRALLGSGAIVHLGPLGPMFTATSSVRTVYCETERFMLKLSIPVKITNSLRINLQTELGDSVWVSQLLRRSEISSEHPQLRAMEDPAYLTVALPDRAETGFEVIFRSNPFVSGWQSPLQDGVCSIIALTQDPLTADGSLLAQAVRSFARAEETELHEAARRWFDAYLKCAIEPPISVYDRHGIALEGHQQNALLQLGPSGLPRYAYYRDLQGLALSACFHDEHIARVPELAEQQKCFEPDDIVRDGFIYYLFVNHLYAVINRFALDGLVDEDTLLEVVRRKLIELRPSMHRLGHALIDVLLDGPSIRCKANLLTRLADMDELQSENELAVYIRVDNPLCAREHARAALAAGVAL